MQAYKVDELAKWIGAKVIVNNSQSVEYLVIDSRTITNVSKALFIAIRGDRHDGHDFISKLYKQGVRNFMVDAEFKETDSYPEGNFLITDNCLQGLQHLAKAKRLHFNKPVIAITGSNGKTIVKEWISQMIANTRNFVRSPKSFNSQVGVPLSVWQLNKEAELGIFEAGISKPGEMSKLADIIKPTIGILVNIRSAHQENFVSKEYKLQEKLLLFKDSDTIIYCADDIMIDRAIKNVYSSKKLVTWGRSNKSVFKLSDDCVEDGIWKFTLHHKDKTYTFNSRFTDRASQENILHALVCLMELGYETKYIQERLDVIVPVAMRMEQKEGVNNCVLVNDSYNSDITSLAISLDFLNQQSKNKDFPKTLILSDIYQSGLSESEMCLQLNELLEKKGIDKLYAVGTILSNNSHVFSMGAHFFTSTEELLSEISQKDFKDEAILIKGARNFGFERIASLLEQKHHETRLEVNLNAFVDNLNYHRSKLKSDTKVLAMVKAFSYGSGSFEIAGVLEYQKVDYLGVAFADEGVELRKAGISLPIIVMNPEQKSFATMINYKLEPELYSFRVIEAFVTVLQSEAVTEYPVHIKLDTGMNRLGFVKEDIDILIKRLKSHTCLNVQSVFSHLAGSDESMFDDFTHEQVGVFKYLTYKLETALNKKLLKHILNSAGILRFPEYQFDMVRIGVGLYGIGAVDKDKLKTVMRFRSYISQIRQVEKKHTIGYSRNGRLNYDATIAVVPVGYADGLNRRLGNGLGNLMINGKHVSIVGNICMDMCMVDITGLDVNEGDEVEIFGSNISVEEVADKLSTIPYEIFTSVSRRVKRVYYYE